MSDKQTAAMLDKFRRQTPLLVGLLTGLMPCGALYAAWLCAMSSGSAVRGALLMLAFALGTVPLMLLFASLGACPPISVCLSLYIFYIYIGPYGGRVKFWGGYFPGCWFMCVTAAPSSPPGQAAENSTPKTEFIF